MREKKKVTSGMSKLLCRLLIRFVFVMKNKSIEEMKRRDRNKAYKGWNEKKKSLISLYKV